MLNETNEAPINRQHLQQSTLTPDNAEAPKLYVGELDTTVDESDLLKVFSKLGKVSSLRISRDAITGISLGYGFIEYDAGCSGNNIDTFWIEEKERSINSCQRFSPAGRANQHKRKNGSSNVGTK
jgi:hypothetical protein